MWWCPEEEARRFRCEWCNWDAFLTILLTVLLLTTIGTSIYLFGFRTDLSLLIRFIPIISFAAFVVLVCICGALTTIADFLGFAGSQD